MRHAAQWPEACSTQGPATTGWGLAARTGGWLMLGGRIGSDWAQTPISSFQREPSLRRAAAGVLTTMALKGPERPDCSVHGSSRIALRAVMKEGTASGGFERTEVVPLF